MPKGRSTRKGHNRKLPTAIKKLNGTDQASRRNDREPIPDMSMPERPTMLSPKAAEHWDQIAPQLHAMGVLGQIDQDALCMYCETAVIWREAMDNVVKYGPVAKQNGRYAQSPYLAAAFNAQKEMRQLIAEFGMSPAARASLKVPDGKDAETGVPAFRAVS